MSPATETEARPELVSSGPAPARAGWIERATSPDHKSVAMLWIGGALAFLAIAVTEFVLMRAQLFVPDNSLIEPELFNRLLTASGATLTVFFAIPLILGIVAYVVPLQIGARGTAFPRLGLLSAWLFLIGGSRLLHRLPLHAVRGRDRAAAAALGPDLLAQQRHRHLDRRRRTGGARVRAPLGQPGGDRPQHAGTRASPGGGCRRSPGRRP